MSAALKSNNCEVTPLHTLELPIKKVGHPYIVSPVITLPQSTSVATVHNDKSLIMMIEVKKSIPAKFPMSEPSDIIEMLMYCTS